MTNQSQNSKDSDGSEDFGPDIGSLVNKDDAIGGIRLGCSNSGLDSDSESDFGPGMDLNQDQGPDLGGKDEELKHLSTIKTKRISEATENLKKVRREEEEDDNDDSLGPMLTDLVAKDFEKRGESDNTGNLREKELERLVNIPKTDFYECSFMHKKQVTHVLSSNRTGFTVTASKDGVIKFWRLRSEKEILREKEVQVEEPTSSSVVTSLEFVKGYQAHKNEVSDVSISNCENYMSSISEKERNVKLYSISDFDMISIIGIPINPSRCVLISSSYGGFAGSVGSSTGTGIRTKFPSTQISGSSGGLIYPQMVVSELETGYIYIFSIKGGDLSRSDGDEGQQGCGDFPRYTNHKARISCMRFLPRLGIIISGDVSGGLEFWDPWTLTLPTRGSSIQDGGDFDQIRFKYKIETDLFELQKNKCYAINMVASRDERYLAIRSSDHKIRQFSVQTGKCIRVFDEDVSSHNIMQSSLEYDYLHIDHLEFGVRSAIEAELQNLPEYYCMQNMVFDETCRFLIYSSMIGICVLDVHVGKRVLIVGKCEAGKRFLNLALLQIHRGVAAGPLVSHGSHHQVTSNVDSVIIASSFKSNRIYVFSKRLPLLDNGDVNLKRDIFNELPSNEEIERQKQLEKFSSRGREKNSSHVRIARQVILHTTKGDITLELFPEIAPKACENFSVHCFNGYYNNCIFHRVIKGFMIQTGDPTGQGTGGVSIWGKEFEDEISPDVRHDEPFTLSMANAGVNTNGSQFFITTVSCPWLDGVHTIFGKVVQGKEIVKEIEHVSTNRNDRPIQDISIISASTVFD